MNKKSLPLQTVANVTPSPIVRQYTAPKLIQIAAANIIKEKLRITNITHELQAQLAELQQQRSEFHSLLEKQLDAAEMPSDKVTCDIFFDLLEERKLYGQVSPKSLNALPEALQESLKKIVEGYEKNYYHLLFRDAARNNSIKILMAFLLYTKIEIDFRYKNDTTALSLAAWTRNGTPILLIQAGADVNIPDETGWTPLHKACSSNSLAIIAYLLQQGADINARTLAEKAPLDCAIINQPEEKAVAIIKLFLSKDPDIGTSVCQTNLSQTIKDALNLKSTHKPRQ